MTADAVSGSRRTALDGVVVVGLGTTLVYGVLAQGGFYSDQLINVLVVAAVATAARLVSRGRRPELYVAVCAGACVLFAGWAVLVGGLHDDIRAALPTAAVSVAVAAAVWAGHGLPEQPRRALQAIVIAAGVVVAASGWVGVALHVTPLALPSAGLWRAASTLTYANAAAAFLVVAAFVALAAIPPQRRVLSLVVLWALLLGLATTMSRAGVLALLAGLVVHAATSPDRSRLLRSWPVLPAVATAFAGLLPSLPDGSVPQPFLALGALCGGVALILVSRHRRARRVVVPALALGLAGVLLSPSAAASLGGIAATRLSGVSHERDDLTGVTLAQFATSPLLGVGPARLDFTYVDHDGVPVRAWFTHNEYVQTAAETGVVGAGLAVVGLAALAVGALRRRAPPAAGPAALAVVAAFAVHSAFDFLWHVPVLPLLLAVSVTTLLPAPPTPEDPP